MCYHVAWDLRQVLLVDDRELCSLMKLHFVRTRRFFPLWLSQLVAQSGDSMSLIAVMWLVYKLTGSPLEMGVLGFVQRLPIVVLGLPLGVLIDRVKRKPTLIGANVVRCILIVSIPFLTYLGRFSIPYLYVVIFVVEGLGVLVRTTVNSFVPSIVDRKDYQSANSLLSLTGQVGLLLGPGLAAFFNSLTSAENTLYAVAATFGASALLLTRIQAHETLNSAHLARPVILLTDLREALRCICHTRAVLLIILVAIVSNALAQPLSVVIPILSDQVWHAGASGYGLVFSSIGAGMIAVSLILALVKQRSDRRISYIFLAILVSGASFVGLGASHTLSYALIFAGLAGVCYGTTQTLIPTELQDLVPADKLGKVFAIVFVSAGMSGAAGMLAIGPLTTFLDPGHIMQAAGFLLIAFSLLNILYIGKSRGRVRKVYRDKCEQGESVQSS